MTLEDLEPKLTRIYVLARHMYSVRHLAKRGLMVQPGTARVVWSPEYRDSNTPPEMAQPEPQIPGADLGAEQVAYDTFCQSLADLIGKFRRFYSLGDPGALKLVADTLGARPAQPGTGALATESGGQPPASSLPTIQDCLNSAERNSMSGVDELISDHWKGGAARSFEKYFVKPFREASDRQMACVGELHVAALACHQAVDKATKDVLTIADLCIEQLSPGHRTPSRGGLATISVLLDIASWLPGWVGKTADALSFGLDVLSVLGSPEAKPKEPAEFTIIGGDTDDAPQVVGSTWDALVKLERTLDSLDASLSEGFKKDFNPDGVFVDLRLRLDTPELANGGDLGTLRDLGQSAVQAERGYIRKAGTVNLPDAAGRYDAALTKLNECGLPGGLKDFFHSSIGWFEEAREELTGVLLSVRNSLADSAEALLRAERDYHQVDEERAAAIRKAGR